MSSMKNSIRIILFSALLVAASAVYGAGVPSLDFKVTDSGGKVVSKGRTNADGKFGVAKLPPGDYIVQFNSGDPAVKSHQYAIIATAGKSKSTADPVPGKKLAGPGVAMKLSVASGGSITGEVRAGAGSGSDDSKVKIINGKRYVWVGPETGSNMGGRWVEEGSVDASKVQRGNADGLRRIQDGAGRGTLPGS